jgi:hypothetical protein
MFASLSQIQISGLIAVLVATPFLIISIRNIVLSKASKQWLKVSGTIKVISDFGSNLKYRLEYEYTLNRNIYRNCRVIFLTSKTYAKRRASEFQNKYSLNQIVDVYYNPKNPKQAVLEPSKNDGALLVVIALIAFMIISSFAIFDPTVFLLIIDSLFQLFN